MKNIVLSGGSVQAVILPDFGGTVAHLTVNGTEVLRLNEVFLGIANVLAGGIPFLFPFASATPGAEAVFLGKSYTMPTHGFAKDLPFETVLAEPDRCELRLTSSDVTHRYYPFDFDLRLIYEVENGALRTTVTVKNTGDDAMPFAMGFHPYFLTPDRTRTTFSFGLKEYWNYLRTDENGQPEHGMLDGGLHLKDDHDTVFRTGCPDCEITCEEPAFRARIECGETFDVITICTTEENASCVEPWQGRPGAAHRPEECQILNPGEEKRYTYAIRLA